MLNEEPVLKNNFIKHIVLENYKSIKKLDIPLGNLNVLIGANGAGKSNFIGFFGFLQQMLKENLRGYVADKGGQEAFLYYGSKVSSYIKFDLQLDDDGSIGEDTINYSVELVPTVQNIFRFNCEHLFTKSATGNLIDEEYNKFYESQVKFYSEYTDLLKDLELGDLETLSKFIVHHFESMQVFHFNDTSEFSAMKQPVSIDDNLYLRSNGANIAAIIKLIHDNYPEYYRLIVDTIRMVVPDFHNFVIRDSLRFSGERIGLEWFNKSNVDIPWSASYLSDGSLRFIALATLLLMPTQLQPQAIIIDEPELGLHPAAINILSGLIKRASHERQVIVSTQSPALLANLEPEDIIIVDKQDKTSEFKRLNKEELAIWLEDFNLAQLWDMNILGGRP